MKGALLGVLVVLGVLGSSAGFAQNARPVVDPWVAWADAEPLELAGVVDRLGDDEVLARLAGAVPTYARLAAVRATPFLRSPELALPALAAIAGSRDPELAPIAARRAFVIAQALTLEGLALREVQPVSLAPARAALARAANATRPRADLRLWLEQAVQLLAALGVP
jgi:hypothetical protein